MKIKLPVTWQVCGEVEVEAESFEQAVARWIPSAHDVPTTGEYVDGSFELNMTEIALREQNQSDG